MYLTVCTPRSPGHGSQWENECISLSVLPVARVMVASGRMNVSGPLHARVRFPAMAQYFG